MPHSDIKLNFFTKKYEIFDNQSIIIWDVQGKDDCKFHFQFRFIENNNKKIDFNQLENKLKNFIDKLTYSKKLIFNKKYAFLMSLKEVGFDLKSIQIIQKQESKNFVFKMDNDQSKVAQESDKNLSALFIIHTFQNSTNTMHFGYEIPDVITGNTTPLYCVSIYSEKELSKKIYLFPPSSKSLADAVSTLQNESAVVLQTLEIPYMEYIPTHPISNCDKDIQTRINLQIIISEILTHLEKPKCFRRNGMEKSSIFKDLAKSIANGETLDNISSKLNAHDTWKLLAQHRDPWGLFSFFKGKTHSVITWEELKAEILNFDNSPHTQRLCN